MADLNEEITLSNGRRITLARLIHEHALLMKYVEKAAKGSSSDKPKWDKPGHVPGGTYITIGAFHKLMHREANELLQEIGAK